MNDSSGDDATHSRHPYRASDRAPLPRRFAWGAFFAFAWVVMGSVAMMLVSHAQPFVGRFDLFALLAVGMLLGVVLAFFMAIRHKRDRPEDRPLGAGFAIAALPVGLFLAWVGAAMVHTAAYMPSYMGRRHRKGKRLLAPETAPGEAWVRSAQAVLDVPEDARAALGAEWRDNGKKEHASVAAFAQLTLDLMAVGAPPELVAASQRDALDEIRHAGACFAIARDIDGLAESPAPFPDARTRKFLFTASREIALTQIAIDALADGVLNEGIASRLLAQLSKACELPAMAPVLREMAADESRHAAHSWDIIAWCLATGGTTVRSALRGAIDGMPSKVCSALPAAARDGAWEKWGVHGVALEAEAFARTREAARVKLTAMLASSPRDAQAVRSERRALRAAASCKTPSMITKSPGASADHASIV